MSADYDRLLAHLREAATLSSVAELLGWDQETMMPPRASAFRAEEQALLARLVHQRATDPRLGELLLACEADRQLLADPLAAANLREIRRDYDRARKLPEDLVAEIGETSSRAMTAWRAARENDDFPAFLPWLERQLTLHRRKAACYGAPPGGELYDALVEDFEPGMTAARIATIFAPLRAALVPLIETVTRAAEPPDEAVLGVALPVERQLGFHESVLRRIGFDLAAGRLDRSTHPFSSSLGPGDTRITTRFSATFFDALGSTLHEAGHALYEQGLPRDERHGQPLAQALGLGIHESQSRLWENHVGRSRAFWSWALPELRREFGGSFDGLSVDEVYAAVNVVAPNLIRVESDEATYNLHIMLRFDLERAMVRGELDARDLPGAWNDRVRSDLGLVVPDDRRGCLQDIHWSMGAFGYFPSYTLGNLYAAQLWEAASQALPRLAENIARGEFEPLLGWLRSEIHVHGRRWPTAELCARITGSDLDHRPLVRHLEVKLAEVYRLGSVRTAPLGRPSPPAE